jgi:hypothetical protein
VLSCPQSGHTWFAGAGSPQPKHVSSPSSASISASDGFSRSPFGPKTRDGIAGAQQQPRRRVRHDDRHQPVDVPRRLQLRDLPAAIRLLAGGRAHVRGQHRVAVRHDRALVHRVVEVLHRVPDRLRRRRVLDDGVALVAEQLGAPVEVARVVADALDHELLRVRLRLAVAARVVRVQQVARDQLLDDLVLDPAVRKWTCAARPAAPRRSGADRDPTVRQQLPDPDRGAVVVQRRVDAERDAVARLERRGALVRERLPDALANSASFPCTHSFPYRRRFVGSSIVGSARSARCARASATTPGSPPSTPRDRRAACPARPTTRTSGCRARGSGRCAGR